mmetsp:Transcript_20713/g.61792  ORF Transcript_20713/g.61792 Transcript_20713/m.61792 type:complete len:246 (+) Transcript_20713:4231-4968(+)
MLLVRASISSCVVKPEPLQFWVSAALGSFIWPYCGDRPCSLWGDEPVLKFNRSASSPVYLSVFRTRCTKCLSIDLRCSVCHSSRRLYDMIRSIFIQKCFISRATRMAVLFWVTSISSSCLRKRPLLALKCCMIAFDLFLRRTACRLRSTSKSVDIHAISFSKKLWCVSLSMSDWRRSNGRSIATFPSLRLSSTSRSSHSLVEASVIAPLPSSNSKLRVSWVCFIASKHFMVCSADVQHIEASGLP